MTEKVESSAEPQTGMWSCSTCGPRPGSRANWCDAGCGSDYNTMTFVTEPQTEGPTPLLPEDLTPMTAEQRAWFYANRQTPTDEIASIDPVWQAGEEAKQALRTALMRLDNEHPSQVYNEKGYTIWTEEVAKAVAQPMLDLFISQTRNLDSLRSDLQRVTSERDRNYEMKMDAIRRSNDLRSALQEMTADRDGEREQVELRRAAESRHIMDKWDMAKQVVQAESALQEMEQTLADSEYDRDSKIAELTDLVSQSRSALHRAEAALNASKLMSESLGELSLACEVYFDTDVPLPEATESKLSIAVAALERISNLTFADTLPEENGIAADSMERIAREAIRRIKEGE